MIKGIIAYSWNVLLCLYPITRKVKDKITKGMGVFDMLLLSVHNINTSNEHHFHRPVANLSCFQMGASYSGIRLFNTLPRSITNLKNEKTHFKVAIQQFL